MPGEEKDPTQGVNVEKDNSENQAWQYSSHKHVANTEGWADHEKMSLV